MYLVYTLHGHIIMLVDYLDLLTLGQQKWMPMDRQIYQYACQTWLCKVGTKVFNRSLYLLINKGIHFFSGPPIWTCEEYTGQPVGTRPTPVLLRSSTHSPGTHAISVWSPGKEIPGPVCRHCHCQCRALSSVSTALVEINFNFSIFIYIAL